MEVNLSLILEDLVAVYCQIMLSKLSAFSSFI